MHFSTNPFILLALSVTSAVASPIVCNEDNPARALERYSPLAGPFCTKYLAGSNSVPYWMTEFPATRIFSACSCYTAKAGPHPVTSTSTPANKPSTTLVPTTKKPTVPTSSLPAVTPKPISSIKPSTSKKASIPSVTKTLVASVKPSSSSVPVEPASSTGGKRGLVYDYMSSDYSKYFVGSQKVTFGSDWHATRGETGAKFDQSFDFIPTLGVDHNSLQNPTWIETVTNLIKNENVKTVFASNEPDNSGQANLTPAQAAQVYKQYMMPLKGLGASLCTPAVTNGGGATGLGYLESFLSECPDCHFDAINIHHYVQRSDVNVDQAVSALKSYIETNVAALQQKHNQLKGLKIILGEFWLWGASESESAEYLQKILPYLDDNDNVASYQAFGGLWKGNFINADGTGLTPAGSVYRDY